MNDMQDKIAWARCHLAWTALMTDNNGNHDRATRLTGVVHLLSNVGPEAQAMADAAEELRGAAVPHPEVADLLETVIGKSATVAASPPAKPAPEVADSLPRVDLSQPAKAGGYVVYIARQGWATPWPMKDGESWGDGLSKSVTRAYGPLPEVEP